MRGMLWGGRLAARCVGRLLKKGPQSTAAAAAQQLETGSGAGSSALRRSSRAAPASAARRRRPTHLACMHLPPSPVPYRFEVADASVDDPADFMALAAFVELKDAAAAAAAAAAAGEPHADDAGHTHRRRLLRA